MKPRQTMSKDFLTEPRAKSTYFQCLFLCTLSRNSFHIQAFKYTINGGYPSSARIIIFLYCDVFDDDNAVSVLAKMEAKDSRCCHAGLSMPIVAIIVVNSDWNKQAVDADAIATSIPDADYDDSRK